MKSMPFRYRIVILIVIFVTGYILGYTVPARKKPESPKEYNIMWFLWPISFTQCLQWREMDGSEEPDYDVYDFTTIQDASIFSLMDSASEFSRERNRRMEVMIASVDMEETLPGRLTTSEIVRGLSRNCPQTRSLIVMGPVSPEVVELIVQLFPDLESLALEISTYDKSWFAKLASDPEMSTAAVDGSPETLRLRKTLGKIGEMPNLRKFVLLGTWPTLASGDIATIFKDHPNLKVYDSNFALFL